MKLVFMGTSIFAVPALQKLIDSSHEISGVITQPDRPSGRGGKLSFPPVKELAIKHNLPLYQPEKIRDPAAIEQVKALAPELIVVVSYGQIIPLPILNLPRHALLGWHFLRIDRCRANHHGRQRDGQN